MSPQRRVSWLDTGPACLTCAAGQLEVWTGHRLGGIGSVPTGSPTVLLAVFVLASTIPLVFLRRRPFTASWAVALALVLQVCLVAPSISLVAGLLPLLIATIGSAVFGRAGRQAVGLLAAIVVQGAATLRIPEERSGGEVTFGLFVLVGGWLLGLMIGSRLRRADAEVAASAELAERHRTQIEHIAAQERLRIARELHDVIAHGVSLMGVQAAAARVMIARDPGRAESALRTVEEQARDSIAELQRLLGVLRSPDEGEPEASPRLASLPRLLAGMREAGVSVDLHVDGEARTLSAGADQAAYRIVQESLTNSLKHGGRAPVRVNLAWGEHDLGIEVVDGGAAGGPATDAPPGDPESGRGLLGMRERVLLYGGTIETGRRPGGGFGVRVVLPLPGPS